MRCGPSPPVELIIGGPALKVPDKDTPDSVDVVGQGSKEGYVGEK